VNWAGIMRVIDLADALPRVRLANHHGVAAGQLWPSRTIPDLELICVFTGAITYRGDDGEATADAGQVLRILPGVRHVFGSAGPPSTVACMHLECHTGRWLDGDYRLAPHPAAVTTWQHDDHIGHAFIRAAALHTGFHRNRRQLLDLTAREILLRLAPAWGKPALADAEGRCRRLIEWIRARARRGFSRTELARAAGVSPGTLNRIFRDELGLTPREVLHRERCRLADERLRDGASVADAATAAGFTDPFYFSRVYHRVYGIAPSRAR
jgi:AraC-like DNA-binding protein